MGTINFGQNISDGTYDASVPDMYTYTIGIAIDGGGSAIATGAKGMVVAPVGGTITEWYLIADTSATATLDVWNATRHVPTDSDSITNNNEPSITEGTYSNKESIVGWSDTSIDEGDVIRFNVDSNDNATFITLGLKVIK